MPPSNQNPASHPQAHQPESQTEINKKIVHRHINESWNQGNRHTASELLADDVRLHDAVFPGLSPGSQNVRNHIEACRRAFPDLKFTIDDTIAERNEVVIHWTARGTHNGDFLGMPPTHRHATVTGTSIYRLRANHIVEEWAHWNLMTMMQQLGVPATPQTEPEPAPKSQPTT